MQIALTWELFTKDVAIDLHGNIVILKHDIGIRVLFNNAIDKLISMITHIHQVGYAKKDASYTKEL